MGSGAGPGETGGPRGRGGPGIGGPGGMQGRRPMGGPGGGPPRRRQETSREAAGKSKGKENWEAAAQNLLDHMDSYGVAKALLMPPPRSEDNIDETEFKGLQDVVSRHPDRFALAGGGEILNVMIHKYKPSHVTPKIRAQFEKEAERLAGIGVKAFGEMAALHLSFTSGHVFLGVQPDHPLFLLLADIAAGRDVAIDLHMEAVEHDMATPDGFGKNNPERLEANIPALEKLLAHNRRARIVWQHIGWDNTGHMTVGLLRRLLKAHPNLYLALRVEERLLQIDRSTPMPNRIVDREGRIHPEWIDLLTEFPDRAVIGTDEFMGIPGKSRRPPQSFEETWRIIDQLQPGLAAKVGRENAIRIYRLN